MDANPYNKNAQGMAIPEHEPLKIVRRELNKVTLMSPLSRKKEVRREGGGGRGGGRGGRERLIWREGERRALQTRKREERRELRVGASREESNGL